jgi:UDP-N-acetylmuramoyl-L-alanyl-D-glutamate--2,6-diaminopimelate ligase
MHLLRDLIGGVPGAQILRGDPGVAVGEVRDDSRHVTAGDLFVAVPGTKSDGREFIADAIGRGAAVVVGEGTAPAALDAYPATAWISVPSARVAVGLIAARRFGAADKLTLTAVTGTNGKTTITYLLESILAAAGRRPGIIGTVNNRYAGKLVPTALTTPGALALQSLLAEMRAAGTTDVAMEVTSIALDQARVAGCRFRVAALTNVTQDHLDYHGTMDRYFAAKAVLFHDYLTDDGVAVLFTDREDGRRMKPHVRGQVLSVAVEPGARADVRVGARRLAEDGITATFETPVGRIEIESALVGDFNLANLATSVGVGVGHGFSPEIIVRGIAEQSAVPGRLERVGNDAGVLCVVDYAHTPDALERALGTLRPLTRGRLIVVFGCGGDRDNAKRAVMGEAAARLGDITVVTSDNPRTEDPGRILGMVVDGVRRGGAVELGPEALEGAARGYLVEADRRVAIRRAVAAAQTGDTLLIAGKGHEDYQILGAVKVPFDDRVEARVAFAARAHSADWREPGPGDIPT